MAAQPSRRTFMRQTIALAGSASFLGRSAIAQPPADNGRLMAYVGTFSSPLKDMLPTQVDRPPGNGRGIHIFSVNRSTGALTPAGAFELGTSPSCLAVNAARTRLYSSNE